MSPNLIAFLRALGTVVAFSVLTYVANATNLTQVVNPTIATIIAGLAATLLATLDHAKSPTGTIGFGSFGR